MSGLAARKRARKERRAVLEAAASLDACPTALQSLVNNMGHTVRCPHCKGQQIPVRGGRLPCSTCLGHGVLRPHHEGVARCPCFGCETKRDWDAKQGRSGGDGSSGFVKIWWMT